MSSNYMTALNAKELFAHWLSRGLIRQAEQPALEEFTLKQQLARELPLYLRALAGVGAFIASLCFIGFFGVSGMISFDSTPSLLFWGVGLMSLAILFVKTAQDHDTVKHSFLMQTSFCFMGTGKILFVMGLANVFEHSAQWGVTVATLLVTLATYHIYRMSIDRFLSSLAVLTSIFFNLLNYRIDVDLSEILLNLFFVAQLGMAALLMTSGKIKRDYMPLAYAVIFSLCMVITFFAVQSKIGYWGSQHDFSSLWIMNIALAATLIALIGWAAGSMQHLKSEPLALASLGAVALGAISAPGILLAIGLMILGYAKHERLLILFGGLLFPLFLFTYYYNLDLSLMLKSGILIGSGAVLLAGRAYLHHRKFDQEA